MLQVVQDDDPRVVVRVPGGDRPQEILQLGDSVRLDGEDDDGLVGGGREVAGGRSRGRRCRGTAGLRILIAIGEVLGESGGIYSLLLRAL